MLFDSLEEATPHTTKAEGFSEQVLLSTTKLERSAIICRLMSLKDGIRWVQA